MHIYLHKIFSMKRKATFSSRIGFLAATIGVAVGLGNIWKFPYEVGANGGAAFLLIYIICIALIGYPLVIAELTFGRKMKQGMRNSFKKASNNSRLWGFMGTLPLVIVLVIMSLYNVVTGWLVGYCISIFNGTLTTVDNLKDHFYSFVGQVPQNLLYTAIITLFLLLVVRNGIEKGIERASKIMMPLFMVLFVGLIVYVLTLENSGKGVAFYLIPDFSLITPKAIYTALGHTCMTLGIGAGVLITYGSYADDKDDIASSARIIVISDTLVSFLAGLLIFPLIFHANIPPNEGPALVFISLPTVFKSMGPTYGVIMGCSFFVLLIFAALTSSISMMESIVKYFMEKYSIARGKTTYMVSAVSFSLSIFSILGYGFSDTLSNLCTIHGVKMNFLDFAMLIVFDIGLPLSIFLFSIFVAYKWGTKNLIDELNLGASNNRPLLNLFLKVVIKYLCPIIVGAILLIQILSRFFGVSL